MPFTPFADICPQIARRETRDLEIVGNPKIPDGTYTFYDNYCDNPYCDCKCVVVEVESQSSPANILTVLTYGWETPDFYTELVLDDEHTTPESGIEVNADSKQSKYAEGLRDILEEYIANNPDYALVLQNHYDAVKATVGMGAVQNKRFLQRRRKLKKKQKG